MSENQTSTLPPEFEDGNVLWAEELNALRTTVSNLYDMLNSAPKLSYVSDITGFGEGEIKYYDLGQNMDLYFDFNTSVYGKVRISVIRTNSAGQQVSIVTNGEYERGRIHISLGKAETKDRYTYTVSGFDGQNRPTENSLTFQHSVGGLTFETNLADQIKSQFFIANNEYNIPYNYKLEYYGEGTLTLNQIITAPDGAEAITPLDVTLNSTINVPLVFTPLMSGEYTIKLCIEATKDNETLLSSEFSEHLIVATNENDIIIRQTGPIQFSDLDGDHITTDSSIIVPFQVNYFKTYAISETLKVVAKLYKCNDDGTVEQIGTKTSEYTVTENNFKRNYEILKFPYFTDNEGKGVNTEYRYEIIPIVENESGLPSGIIPVRNPLVGDQFTVYPGLGAEFITENLIAYFDASEKSNTNTDRNQWNAQQRFSAENQRGWRFNLKNLQFTVDPDTNLPNINGWFSEIIDGKEYKFLRLNKSGYGLLEKADGTPVNLFNSVLKDKNNLAIEMMVRGDKRPNSLGYNIACMGSNYGFYVKPEEAGVLNGVDISDSSQVSLTNKTNITSEEWHHIVFMLAGSTTPDKLTDLNNYNPRPSLRIYIDGCLVKVSDMALETYKTLTNINFYLNTKEISDIVKDFYSFTDIRFIRIYDRALTNSEIYTNHIASLSPSERLEVESRNNMEENLKRIIPIITFTTKAESKNSFNEIGRPGYAINTFTPETKAQDKANGTKVVKSEVWTKMEYRLPESEEVRIQDNVSVLVQGTSSLSYPVKNYQIKVFSDATHETKNKNYKPENAPANWKGDYSYTLKCDYMEHSHRNNTPTALYYNNIVLPYILNHLRLKGSAEEAASPARQQEYLDAISGFPCLVYIVEYSATASEEQKQPQYLGTYMFNTDKAGMDLGFEMPLPDDEEMKEFTLQLYDFNEIDGTFSIQEGSQKRYKTTCIPCISYEGGTNADVSAATFVDFGSFQKEIERIEAEDPSLKGKLNYSDKYEYYNATLEPRYNCIEELTLLDEDGKAIKDEDGKKLKIESDLGDTTLAYTFAPLDKALTWLNFMWPTPKDDTVEDMELNFSDDKKAKYRREFGNYFSYEYCLAYFLQAMTFTQVDNIGKNAMFDVWWDFEKNDWSIIYPRPYDMDSQMGINNQGQDIILTSAEVNSKFSPATDKTADYEKNPRYVNQYAVSVSKLWTTFAYVYADEIRAAYQALRRSAAYTVDNICNYVEELTSNKIGERFYNQDACKKYLSQGLNPGAYSTFYVPMIQGNRDNRYRYFLSKRIDFLDTYFGYRINFGEPGAPVYDTIEVRVNKGDGETTSSAITLYPWVSQPSYISVGLDTSSQQTSFIDPEQNGQIPFSFFVQGDNKNAYFYNSRFLERLDGITKAQLTLLEFKKAESFTEFILENNAFLITLNLSGQQYLKNLSLKSCSALTSLTLPTQCTYLKKLTLHNYPISQSLNLNDTNLKYLDLDTVALTDLSITNAPFASYSFKKCTSLRTLTLNNCYELIEFKDGKYVDGKVEEQGLTALTNLTISNCSNLEVVDLPGCKASTIAFSDNPNIKALRMPATQTITVLDISTLSELEELDLQDCSNLQEIIIPQQGLPKLKTLKLNGCGKLIKLRRNNCEYTDEPNTIDLTGMQLTSLSFSNCLLIKKIIGLNYEGNCSNLFYKCNALEIIEGNCVATGTSISEMFRYCYKINSNNLSNFSFSDKNDTITSLSHTFADCYGFADLSFPKKIIDACKNATSFYGLFAYGFADKSGGINFSGQKLFKLPSGSRNGTGYDFGLFAYNSHFKTVSSDLFEGIPQNTISNVKFAFYASDITSFDCSCLSNYIGGLTSLKGLLGSCSALTTVSNLNSLKGKSGTPNNIKDISLLFYETPKITTSIGDLKAALFSGLPNLETAWLAFYNSSLVNGNNVISGLLSANTKLKHIGGMFANCSNFSLPDNFSLFQNDIHNLNTSSHPYLTNASALFANCEFKSPINLTEYFFCGANNLEYLSNLYIDSTTFGISATESIDYGAFGNITSIESISADLFKHNSSLKSAYKLFKGTKLSMSYKCKEDDLEVKSFVIPYKLFKDCSKLTNLESAFDSTEFIGINNPSTTPTSPFLPSVIQKTRRMFYKSKVNDLSNMNIIKNHSALTNTEQMFMGCTDLFGRFYIYEGGQNITDLNFFEGCTGLSDASGMFAGCISLGEANSKAQRTQGAKNLELNIAIPVHFFRDCVNLSQVDSMFSHCYNLTGKIGIGSEALGGGLFATNTALSNCSQMFANCYLLTGAIPEDIFYNSNNTAYTSLTNISGMFFGCSYLATKLGTSILGFNKENIYNTPAQQDMNAKYLVPQNWLTLCPNLTNVSKLFSKVGYGYTFTSGQTADNDPSGGSIDNKIIALQVTGYEYYKYLHNSLYAYLTLSGTQRLSGLILPSNLFEAQDKIVEAQEAFSGLNELIYNTNSNFGEILRNNLNTLTNVEGMFITTKIYSIGDIESGFIFIPTTIGAQNDVINKMDATFACASGTLTGNDDLKVYDHYISKLMTTDYNSIFYGSTVDITQTLPGGTVVEYTTLTARAENAESGKVASHFIYDKGGKSYIRQYCDRAKIYTDPNLIAVLNIPAIPS